MDYDMTMQALQAFGNSLTNNANVIMASNTSKADRKFSREMSDLAWERNLMAWRLQNAYNDPINQYGRQLEGLKVNGLNPNLVYGSSSSVTGAASSPSPYKFEGYHSTAVPQFKGDATGIQSLLSTRLLQTQVAAQEANNRLLNARADNEEARLPGLSAKSNEAAYRWNYIMDNLSDNYDEQLRASVAYEYWKGVKMEHEAKTAGSKRTLAYYEAAMAEWLNETEIEGLGMTYRQYMEHCKAFLPGAQYDKLKAEVLNISSLIAYRAEQGQYLRLKEEFQTYVNRLAKFGRSLGNDWVTLLISGLQELFPHIKGNVTDRFPVTERPKSPVERGAMESDLDDNIHGGGSSW